MPSVKLRVPRLLVFLAILWHSSALASSIVNEALDELFKPISANATTRAALLTDLNTLLTLGASQPGQKLLHLHEYADPRARQLGTSIIASLSTSNLDEWTERVGAIIPKLDDSQTFSLVRRLVVAAVVRYWLQHDQKLPDTSAEKLKPVFLKLYERHRVGAINKGAMEYLHVSKAGGTTWCHIAQLNGCLTERYDRSYVCQIKKFDDKVRWLNMTFHMMQVPVYRVPQYVLKRFSRYGTFRKNHEAAACSARKGLVASRNYTYYSNEYTVHGGHKGMDNAHMCASFFNAIVMRDPLKRLVSHMKFVMWTMSGDRGYNDTQLFKRMYANRTAAFWQDLGPAMVDNYFIRSLLGEQAFHVPVGKVTPEMLALAELVLAQFDLVMVLEQDVAVRNLILYYGVGWKHTMEEVHDKDSGVREAEFNTSRYIPADVNTLLAGQVLDQKLYQFSKTLALLDPVVFSVARKAGIEPLPPSMADPDDLQCGMLRGHNRTQLLAGLGIKPGKKRGRGQSGRRGRKPAAALAAAAEAKQVAMLLQNLQKGVRAKEAGKAGALEAETGGKAVAAPGKDTAGAGGTGGQVGVVQTLQKGVNTMTSWFQRGA